MVNNLMVSNGCTKDRRRSLSVSLCHGVRTCPREIHCIRMVVCACVSVCVIYNYDASFSRYRIPSFALYLECQMALYSEKVAMLQPFQNTKVVHRVLLPCLVVSCAPDR